MNQCHFLGNLTRDPVVRTTSSGKKVANFDIAVNEYRKGDKPAALFLKCEAWEHTADFVEKYFEKGKAIIVHGSLRKEKWTDKDGAERETFVLRVTSVEFVPGTKQADAVDGEARPAAKADKKADKKTDDDAPAAEEDEDSEIPF